MEKRVTVKDIAQTLRISTGTVHRALNGKGGVGDEMRNRVCQTAKEMGYVPNYMAASLKKRTTRVVLALPDCTAENEYFFEPCWQELHENMSSYQNMNVDFIELPYLQNEPEKGFASRIAAVLEEYNGEIDGVLTGGLMMDEEGRTVHMLGSRGIPVVLVSESFDGCECLASVESDHYTDGQLAAEMMSRQIPPEGTILVCGGETMLKSNRTNLRGFLDYFVANCPQYNIITVYGLGSTSNLQQCLADNMRTNRTAGIYSVNARNSLMMIRALRETGMGGRICAIGTDLYPETRQALEDGTLWEIIYKDPRFQVRTGLSVLMDYLLQRKQPAQVHQLITSVVVLKSNLKKYTQH